MTGDILELAVSPCIKSSDRVLTLSLYAGWLVSSQVKDGSFIFASWPSLCPEINIIYFWKEEIEDFEGSA